MEKYKMFQTTNQYHCENKKQMEVSWIMGVPPVIIHFDGLFHYETSISFLGTPIFGNLHMKIWDSNNFNETIHII